MLEEDNVQPIPRGKGTVILHFQFSLSGDADGEDAICVIESTSVNSLK